MGSKPNYRCIRCNGGKVFGTRGLKIKNCIKLPKSASNLVCKIPFDYKDCINSDESNTNNKSEAIMSSKPNYRHMIRSSAGKGFGKTG